MSDAASPRLVLPLTVTAPVADRVVKTPLEGVVAPMAELSILPPEMVRSLFTLASLIEPARSASVTVPSAISLLSMVWPRRLTLAERAESETLPAVAMVASLVSTMAAPAAISALTMAPSAISSEATVPSVISAEPIAFAVMVGLG